MNLAESGLSFEKLVLWEECRPIVRVCGHPLKIELTVARLRERLSYDSETGFFTWNPPIPPRCSKKERAGFVDPHGYRRISIDGHDCFEHRLAWLYVYGDWPEKFLDHKNGVQTDNRIDNLRQASQKLNMQNKRVAHVNSRTGFLGVSKPNKMNSFVAHICADGKRHYIGSYPTAEIAHQAYVSAKRQLHKGCTI